MDTGYRKTHRLAHCAITISLLVGLCLPAGRACAQEAPPEEPVNLVKQWRAKYPFSARLSYTYMERDVIEYDDQHITTEEVVVDGEAEITRIMGAFSYRPTWDLEASLLLGVASTDISGIPRFPFNFDFGPAWGVAAEVGLDDLHPYGIDLRLFFDYIHASPGDWDSSVTGKRVSFSADTEDWALGLRGEGFWAYGTYFAGFQYSDFELVYEHPSREVPGEERRGGFEASDNWGLRLGGTYAVHPQVDVFATVNAIDATGVTLGMEYAF